MIQNVLGYAGLGALAAGILLSMFPLWKSATLSPDAIERRVYWAGCAIGVPLLFLSRLPDWGSSFFVSIATAIGMVSIALFWTNFVKINGRIYSAFHLNRRPDRPPAIRTDGEE